MLGVSATGLQLGGICECGYGLVGLTTKYTEQFENTEDDVVVGRLINAHPGRDM